MSRIRKAFKATAVGQLFAIMAMLLSLIAVPLYLQWLGQERYGLLLTGMALGSYLMFADGGLTWASMLLIAEASGRDDRTEIASIVRNSLSLAGCSAFLVAAIVAGVIAITQRLGHVSWLPSHAEFPALLIVLGASTCLTLLFSPFYNVLIGLQEAHLAGLYQGVGRLLGMVLMLLLAHGGLSLAWIFSGNVLASFLTSLAAALHCRRRHRWVFVRGSFWDRSQIQRQLRMSFKSFIMQVGSIFWGTAPVLAIGGAVGPQAVPTFTIPVALLNAPFGLLTSFCANLQAGYGEAMARGDVDWITRTIQELFRKAILLMGILGVGYMLLAGPFIALWINGHLQSTPLMLLSAWLVVSSGTLLSLLRYALTGINRHRNAAVADLICGVLCLVFVVLSVRLLGPDWVGIGVVLAVLLSNGWLLPRELARALQWKPLWPPGRFWLKFLFIILISGGCGWFCLAAISVEGVTAWVRVLVSGVTILGVYAQLSWWLFPKDVEPLRKAALSIGKKIFR